MKNSYKISPGPQVVVPCPLKMFENYSRRKNLQYDLALGFFWGGGGGG